MAGPRDDQLQCKKATNNNSSTVLASQGVDFLLCGEEKVPVSRIEGKTICLFFSANWCRPCKVFTPQLVQLHNNLLKMGKNMEIIFISFDRDEEGFREHLKLMPSCLAVPFDVSLRKRLSNCYRVDRIPLFIPLGSDGASIEEDAVELIQEYGADAFPFTRERREELKAMDDTKRQGGKLEELLTCEGRNNYLISRYYGTKICVSELAGKTVGLYFGAHWCPPCQAFTAQLTEAYNDILHSNSTPHRSSFEIVYVSSDRDFEEFDLHTSKMPWLAIPYEDEEEEENKTIRKESLCRIFNIKRIPALVLLGPDGKTISTDGRGLISLYGAKAFPFTHCRVAEIEADLRKEGEMLPPQVKDPKHDHLLKLEMVAKAGYVCDSCRNHGRFWAFSCDVCDYDLHPTCLEQPP